MIPTEAAIYRAALSLAADTFACIETESTDAFVAKLAGNAARSIRVLIDEPEPPSNVLRFPSEHH